MSKKYNREERLTERLQEENRKLKSENKTLRRKLRETTKGYYKFMIAEDEEEEKKAIETVKTIAKKICYTCQIGELILVDLGVRYYRQCNN